MRKTGDVAKLAFLSFRVGGGDPASIDSNTCGDLILGHGKVLESLLHPFGASLMGKDADAELQSGIKSRAIFAAVGIDEPCGRSNFKSSSK